MSERTKMKAFLEQHPDVTLQVIADKAGVQKATVSRIVNRRRVGRPQTLARVAEAFASVGCPIDPWKAMSEPAA